MKTKRKTWHALVFLILLSSLMMPRSVQAHSSELVSMEQQMPCTPITTYSPSYNFSSPPVNLMLMVYKASLAFEASIKYCDSLFSLNMSEDSVTVGSSLGGTGVKIKSDGNFETSFPVSVSGDSHSVVTGSFPVPFIAYQHHFNRSVNVTEQGLNVSSSNSQEHKFEFSFPDTVQFNYAVDPSVVEQLTYSLAALGAAVLVVEAGLPAAAGAAIFIGVMTIQPPPEAQAAAVTTSSISSELRAALDTKFPQITRVAGFGTLSSSTQQVNPGDSFTYTGQGYSPNGEVLITFGLPESTDLEWKIVQADATGSINGTLTLPSADQVPSGRYLLSATDQTTAYYAAKNILNSGSLDSGKVYMAGTMLDVVHGTASATSLVANNQHGWFTTPAPVSCANISLHDPHIAYLFAGVNCAEDITWFSAHPENGPSANSSSLYVPSNSVVKVASQDNGGGETACFNSTQTDLGSWKNKIQWTQLIPGGSCPVISTDGYVIHTNQGDFRVNVGQNWDNTQHNRQILGFDRQGSAHLKINHLNGAQRCWDETKSAQQLQNDGDWWIQTRSIEIGSGYCPGMSGQLEVYSLANYQGGRHDIRAGNIRTYPVNDLKYSLKFTQPGMSAKFTNADNRTRCFNQNVTNLQDFEDYWRTTVKIEVLGTDVCPPIPATPTATQFAAGTGVYFRYYEYEGGFPGLPVSSTWQPHRTGSVGNFSLHQVGHRENAFAIAFRSCLAVPTTGTYTFFLVSDDGSELYLNGSVVVDNDGHHPVQEKFGQVNLTAGVHTLEVQYFEGGVDQSLGVAWSGPGMTKQWIPNNNLSTTGCNVVADQMPSDPVGTNVALNKRAYAVAQVYGLATQAVDGNLGTSWNGSGLAPRWIEIDLGAEYTIKYIQGIPNQYPSGESHHQTWLAGENRQFYLYSQTKAFTQAGARVILHNPATRPTGKARYVRIYTVSSPSWVSWYEVEVYSTDTPSLPANLALNKPATASGNAGTSAQSFDGNRTTTGWNANGLAPQWIEVDLGAEYELTAITGYVNQSPAGPTKHQVWLAGNDHLFSLYSEVASETQRYQLVPLSSPDQLLSGAARYVRIVTTSSPSWVTWYEIEVYGLPAVTGANVAEERQVPVQLYLPVITQ